MVSCFDEREPIYDAVVVSVVGEGERATSVFRTPDDRSYCLEGEPLWEVDEIGCLRMPGPTTRYGNFDRYPDQRLRRWPNKDVRSRGAFDGRRLGWRLIGVRDDPILLREGIVPGVNGEFVPDRRESVTLSVPYEFIELCEREGVSPQEALAVFAANVCDLENGDALPREDGLSTSGPRDTLLARRYFSAVYGLPAA